MKIPKGMIVNIGRATFKRGEVPDSILDGNPKLRTRIEDKVKAFSDREKEAAKLKAKDEAESKARIKARIDARNAKLKAELEGKAKAGATEKKKPSKEKSGSDKRSGTG